MSFLGNFNKNMVQIAAHDPRFQISPPSPAYPEKESGVCLIVGTHPSALDDAEAALLKYPSAKVCGVNEAPALIPCDHLATCHPDKLVRFIELHDRTWDGRYRIPTLHIQNLWDKDLTPIGCFNWRHNFGGGSAIFAAVCMIGLGFDLVILCGCPIDGGGGYAMQTHPGTLEDPRLGDMSPEHSMIKAWHSSIDAMIETAPHIAGKIRSMSGHTKERFGGIA